MLELEKKLQELYDLAKQEYNKNKNVHVLLLIATLKDAMFNLKTGIERDAARNN